MKNKIHYVSFIPKTYLSGNFNKMKKHILYFLLLFISLVGNAQVSIKDSTVAVVLVGTSYAFQLPGGNLADRFGYNSNAGMAFFQKTKKNWLWSVNGSFMFGNRLKETGMLDSISTQGGYIIDQNGEFADIRLYERGFTASACLGKLIPAFGPNPNSGIFFLAGAGFMQHKIRIESIGNRTPQLNGDYKKGYDRLTGGFALTQFVGYLFLSNNRLANFYAGFECTEGFTQSQRTYDYDLMKRDNTKRKDLLYGIRIGWILPLYKKAPKQFYYY